MSRLAALTHIGHRVEVDDDTGYAGTSHMSFIARSVPRVPHILATPVGDAALERIYRMLRDRRAGRGR